METKDRISQINCIVFKPVEGGGYKFLVMKTREDKGSFWQSVTGGAKEGEQEIFALKRELKEETGIEEFRQIINLRYSYSFFLPRYGNLIENVYAVEAFPDTDIILSDEHTEYRWLDFEESLALIKHESNKEGLRRLWKILNR